MKKPISSSVIWFSILVVMFGCDSVQLSNNDPNRLFEIRDFNALDNISSEKTGDTIQLSLDYIGAFDNGFIIPSVRQVDGGKFRFVFHIKNNTGKEARFRYKVHYQNESYKFNEFESDGGFNKLAHENFYGSWDDTTSGFKLSAPIPADGEFHAISDSFRIVGNPRFERKCFENGVNQRWKRNPRVGVYAFNIIVATGDVFKGLPEPAIHFNKFDSAGFVNPTFFYTSLMKKQDGLAVIPSNRLLKVDARPDPGSGIYSNPFHFPGLDITGKGNAYCGVSDSIYLNAAFEQFINNVDKSMRFENIPVVRDVMGEDYTQMDYNYDKAFYRRDETVSVLPGVAKYPCETVSSDPVTKSITMRNPGTKEGVWRKESVGIRTRHGFTYGKYRLKCKLTELLNKNNVWNGLTNAIWLLAQPPGGEWNHRRSCDKTGYMETYWGGDNDNRVPLISYSEIDFEILKATPYCPTYNYPPLVKNPIGDVRNSDKWNVGTSADLEKFADQITVACTNWDMACPQPSKFDVGCQEVTYDGKTFFSHRWTEKYRALSQKTYQSDDELFGSDYYYFEIDWRPTEIIWRIGPSPDKMRVVGYMNDQSTSIPNNQMTLIVTQEYHNTKWWPGSPFDQENLPFPSKDLIGKIYELVIE
jgi:hypothetical protein